MILYFHRLYGVYNSGCQAKLSDVSDIIECTAGVLQMSAWNVSLQLYHQRLYKMFVIDVCGPLCATDQGSDNIILLSYSIN